MTSVADLSDDEALELGPLLRQASIVATQLVDADQVYNCLWSHAGGVPVHIHYVVQPVSKSQLSDFGVHGPNLQVAMFSYGELPTRAEVERLPDLHESFSLTGFFLPDRFPAMYWDTRRQRFGWWPRGRGLQAGKHLHPRRRTSCRTVRESTHLFGPAHTVDPEKNWWSMSKNGIPVRLIDERFTITNQKE